MKKLIDPVHIIEKLAQRCLAAKGLECCVLGEVIDMVKAAPAVEAVKVVHCRECKHWKHMGGFIGDCSCPRYHLLGHANPSTGANDFCSCGERRAEDGK